MRETKTETKNKNKCGGKCTVTDSRRENKMQVKCARHNGDRLYAARQMTVCRENMKKTSVTSFAFGGKKRATRDDSKKEEKKRKRFDVTHNK